MTEIVMMPKIRSGLFEVATRDASPPARMTLWAVCTLFVLILLWALIARIDIVSVAQGRLVPETYVKIVQPTAAGIIREILVDDGDRVEKDQVLIRLDATDANADSAANSQQLQLERLQLRRLEAEMNDVPLVLQPGDDAALYARVEAQYRTHRRTVEDAVGQAAAARDRANRELAAGVEELTKLKKTAPLMRKSAEAYRNLADQNLVGKLEADDRERLATEREQDVHAQLAKVESLRAALVEAERSLAQVTSKTRSDLQAALVESAAKVAQLEQADVKLGFRGRNLELRAP
jgi:HlyD family secretion protein